MTRIIGVPGPPPGGQIGFGVNAPPPVGPPGATDCTCANLGVVWFNGTAFATIIDTDDAFPSFAITGTICPDTTYAITPSWAPDAGGAEPIINQFGASAWAVAPPVEGEPYDDGVLSVTVAALCAGRTFTLGPIFLTIIAGTYTVDCLAPTEYTNLLTLINDGSGCLVATLNGVVGDITFTAFDSFQIDNGPYYQSGDDPAATFIRIAGLDEMFGDSDMDVRVTVFSNSLDAPGFPSYVDNHNSDDDTVSDGASWEYTVANADLNDWFTGAGVGDGAGGTGSCEFQIEIKVAA